MKPTCETYLTIVLETSKRQVSVLCKQPVIAIGTNYKKPPTIAETIKAGSYTGQFTVSKREVSEAGSQNSVNHKPVYACSTMEDQLLMVLAAVALTVVLGLALIVCITNHPTKLQPCQPVMETSQDRGTLVTGSKDNKASDMTTTAIQETVRE